MFLTIVQQVTPSVVGGAKPHSHTWCIHVLLSNKRLRCFDCRFKSHLQTRDHNFNVFIQPAPTNLPEHKLHFVQPHKHPELLVFSLGVGRRRTDPC